LLFFLLASSNDWGWFNGYLNDYGCQGDWVLPWSRAMNSWDFAWSIPHWCIIYAEHGLFINWVSKVNDGCLQVRICPCISVFVVEGRVRYPVSICFFNLEVLWTALLGEFCVVCVVATKVSWAILVRLSVMLKLLVFWHKFKSLVRSSINLENRVFLRARVSRGSLSGNWNFLHTHLCTPSPGLVSLVNDYQVVWGTLWWPISFAVRGVYFWVFLDMFHSISVWYFLKCTSPLNLF
jgi:hypothetical protein